MKRLRKPHNIIIIFCIIAVINAIYLTTTALADVGSFCDINATFSCKSVFTFPWAWIGPIPFPAIAVIVYPVLGYFARRGGTYAKSSLSSRKILRVLAVCGILFNNYFIYHEYIDNIYCPLCLICTAIIIAIAIMSHQQVIKISKK